jgi:integrase
MGPELGVVSRSVLSPPPRKPSGPRFGDVKALVLDTLSSSESKRAYNRALTDFIRWGIQEGKPPFLKATVYQHKAALATRGLSPSAINVRLAAIRKLASEAADSGLIDPAIAAGIRTVKGSKRRGVRSGNWLGSGEAETLLRAAAGSTTKAKRDTALLAVLLGCGLRRSELVQLEYRHIEQRDGRWVIVDLVGKAGRVRTVPVPSWCKVAIDEWSQAVGRNTGRVFVRLKKNGTAYGDALTDSGVYKIALEYAARARLSVAPHDLRRTFAKLAHRGGAPLEQIQFTLGHASIQTTERYLGGETGSDGRALRSAGNPLDFQHRLQVSEHRRWLRGGLHGSRVSAEAEVARIALRTSCTSN